MCLKFSKYHGLGNDYLVYDCTQNKVELSKDDVMLICNRNFGLGSDGILVGPLIVNDEIWLKIYNPDGSEAEKSGNGVRIFAQYLKDTGYVKRDEFQLHTLGGEVTVTYHHTEDNIITVSMGQLSFRQDDIGFCHTKKELIDVPLTFGNQDYNCTCVSIGNPHCVIPMPEVSKDIVCEIGKHSEIAGYFPNRINTQIVKVLDRNNIQIEIYERGAGYTLASGSSSCAAAGAVYRLGLVDSDVSVHMPGGILKISIDRNWNVRMTGPVCRIGEMQLAKEFVKQNRIGGRKDRKL